VFLHGTDPLALVYSIFGLLDIEDQEKYRVLTLFDEEKRMDVIRNMVQNIRHDVSFNVTGFIKIKKESGFNYSTAAFFVLLFLLIYFVNRENPGDL